MNNNIINENVKLMNGDCLDKLRQVNNESISAVITDPPYNISRANNFATMGRAGIDFGEWDKNFDLTSWIKEVFYKLHTNISILVFLKVSCNISLTLPHDNLSSPHPIFGIAKYFIFSNSQSSFISSNAICNV